jgi:hypothetical protein
MPHHKGSDGGIGRHAGLKIQGAAMPVRVQVPLRVQPSFITSCFSRGFFFLTPDLAEI